MYLTTSAFIPNRDIPATYTCDGENISPPLDVSGVPEGTKSLALIVDDPDAPSGTWVHWAVWNIPPDTMKIYEGTPPKGVEGMTSFNKPGYGGPCPPSGTHRYYFKLFALDAELNLTPKADAAALEREMAPHILARAELIGLYARGSK